MIPPVATNPEDAFPFPRTSDSLAFKPLRPVPLFALPFAFFVIGEAPADVLESAGEAEDAGDEEFPAAPLPTEFPEVVEAGDRWFPAGLSLPVPDNAFDEAEADVESGKDATPEGDVPAASFATAFADPDRDAEEDAEDDEAEGGVTVLSVDVATSGNLLFAKGIVLTGPLGDALACTISPRSSAAATSGKSCLNCRV